MLELYGSVAVSAVQNVAMMLATLVLGALVPSVGVWMIREWCTIRVLEIGAE